MNRVSTAANYATALANLMSAQGRQIEAGTQVSSQKKAVDLKGYARQAETLTAMRSLQTRTTGYIDQTSALGDKLRVQDTALNQIKDAVQSARQAIANALAADRGDTLMQELSGEFSNVTQGLNAKHDGQYLFSGGLVNTPPTTAAGLASLTAAPTTASLFQNGSFVAQNRLDDSTTVQTGMLADQIGTATFNAFAAVQAFEQGGGGPFAGPLTAAQRTFLQGQLAAFDAAHDQLVQVAGTNGLAQNQVESAQEDLGHRADMLETMIGNVTDVDMAEAVSRLQQAQLSVQAAAQVFSTLQGASLLNYLRS
jgi:flagellar hook-associated protein 3 FlgL